VSCLWGLWHLPIMPKLNVGLLGTVAALMFVHGLIGVPLSLYWRRSGNLGVPSLAHAWIDAVRDALLDAGTMDL